MSALILTASLPIKMNKQKKVTVCGNCHKMGHRKTACARYSCAGLQFCGISKFHPKLRKKLIYGFSSATSEVVQNLCILENAPSIKTSSTNNFSHDYFAAAKLFFLTIRDLKPERNVSEIVGVILRCAVKFLNEEYDLKLCVEKEEVLTLELENDVGGFTAGQYLNGPVDFVVHLREGCHEADDKIVLIVEVKTEETFPYESSINQLKCEVIAGWDENVVNQSYILYNSCVWDDEDDAPYIALEYADEDTNGFPILQPVRGVLVSLSNIKTVHCKKKKIAISDETIASSPELPAKVAMMFDIFVRSIVGYVEPYLSVPDKAENIGIRALVFFYCA